MPNYTYRCVEGHEFDSVVPVGTSERACACGLTAQKQSLYAINQREPSVRHEGRDFIEASEQVEYPFAEFEKREGIAVERPKLWSAAKQEADRAQQGVRADSS